MRIVNNHPSKTLRLPALATIATLALLVAGCGGGDAGASASGNGCDGNEVSVGITSSASDAPFYVAKDKGYFEDEGLSVDFVPFDSAAKMIAPLGGGQLDVGAGAPSAGFYNAVSRDVNLRIVADKGSMPENYGYMPLMVRTELFDSGQVTSIEDLEGLKIAEPAQATATSSTLSTMLGSAELSYDDVQHEFIGFSSHVAAFQNGAIDASLTTEPSATIAEQEGVAVRLATPPEFYDNQQLAVVLYSATFADEDADAAQCFMDAYLKGARDYVSAMDGGQLASGPEGEEIAKIVSEATGLEPELYKKITPNYVEPNGHVNVESLEKDYEFFKDQGFLEGSVEIADIVDPSFAEKSVENLGEFTADGS